ncbi:MAG: acylphosphatase [Pseudomonadota bacterium]
MTSRRFWIAGKVQGVFFREWTRQQANRLRLAGHALNTADGRVEVLAFGSEAALDELAEKLQQGPPAARVERVVTELVPEENPPSEGFITGWQPAS